MTNMINFIHKAIEESINVKDCILNDKDFHNKIEQAIDICVDSLRNDGTIWFAGNGGSAADAQHLAAELSGRFNLDRKSLRAEALHVNSSFLTAVANDYGYNMVYSRLLEGCARKNDVLVAISTSGDSRNVVEAAKLARELNLRVISFTGDSGGDLRSLSDVLLNVPSNNTARIQECHILLGHILCENIERELFP